MTFTEAIAARDALDRKIAAARELKKIRARMESMRYNARTAAKYQALQSRFLELCQIINAH